MTEEEFRKIVNHLSQKIQNSDIEPIEKELLLQRLEMLWGKFLDKKTT